MSYSKPILGMRCDRGMRQGFLPADDCLGCTEPGSGPCPYDLEVDERERWCVCCVKCQEECSRDV